jgi:hypothetical protein
MTYPKNAIPMGAEPGAYPPWTDSQRDAQIEALRFAFCELVSALNSSGVLDAQQVLAGLGNSGWLYADKKPNTHAAVDWLADTIDYMRSKNLGPQSKG